MQQYLSDELSFLDESIASVQLLLSKFVDVEIYSGKKGILYKYTIKHPHPNTTQVLAEFYGSYLTLAMDALSSPYLHVIARVHAAAPLLPPADPSRSLPGEYRTKLLAAVYALKKTNVEVDALKNQAEQEIPRLIAQIKTLQANIPGTVQFLMLRIPIVRNQKVKPTRRKRRGICNKENELLQELNLANFRNHWLKPFSFNNKQRIALSDINSAIACLRCRIL